MSPKESRLLRAFFLISAVFFFMPAVVFSETVKIGGTGGAMRTMQILADLFKKSHPEANFVIVPGLGSGGGRKAVLSGAIDIAVTSKAGGRAEKVEGATAVEYGRTPLIFATSNKTSASNLTVQELVNIYSVKTTTWPDGSRLRLILRPESDSDTGVLKSISPAMEEAVKIALKQEGMKMAVTDQDSADAIETISGAMGTSGLALIMAEKRNLKALSVNGVAPSVRRIADGSYPYFKSLYMITSSTPSETTQKFLAFVRSPAGRKMLEGLGHWVTEGKASP